MFRVDPYNRDEAVLKRFAEAGDGMKEAEHHFEIDLSDLTEPVIENVMTDKPALASASGVRKPGKPVLASPKLSARDQAPAAKAPSVLKKVPVKRAPLASPSVTAKRKPTAKIDELAPKIATPKAKVVPADR